MKPFTIELVTKKRTWYLAAESMTDQDAWIQVSCWLPARHDCGWFIGSWGWLL